MNLDPQRGGTRRSRWLALALFLLLAGGWGAGTAWADIYVHVMNCTDKPLLVQAFDAKDSVKVAPASEKKFGGEDPGESEQLHCAGEGEGFCQMRVGEPQCTEFGAGASFHLDSGKWAVVRSVGTSPVDCTAEVDKNLDAAPSSCD